MMTKEQLYTEMRRLIAGIEGNGTMVLPLISLPFACFLNGSQDFSDDGYLLIQYCADNHVDVLQMNELKGALLADAMALGVMSNEMVIIIPSVLARQMMTKRTVIKSSKESLEEQLKKAIENDEFERAEILRKQIEKA